MPFMDELKRAWAAVVGEDESFLTGTVTERVEALYHRGYTFEEIYVTLKREFHEDESGEAVKALEVEIATIRDRLLAERKRKQMIIESLKCDHPYWTYKLSCAACRKREPEKTERLELGGYHPDFTQREPPADVPPGAPIEYGVPAKRDAIMLPPAPPPPDSVAKHGHPNSRHFHLSCEACRLNARATIHNRHQEEGVNYYNTCGICLGGSNRTDKMTKKERKAYNRVKDGGHVIEPKSDAFVATPKPKEPEKTPVTAPAYYPPVPFEDASLALELIAGIDDIQFFADAVQTLEGFVRYRMDTINRMNGITPAPARQIPDCPNGVACTKPAKHEGFCDARPGTKLRTNAPPEEPQVSTVTEGPAAQKTVATVTVVNGKAVVSSVRKIGPMEYAHEHPINIPWMRDCTGCKQEAADAVAANAPVKAKGTALIVQHSTGPVAIYDVTSANYNGYIEYRGVGVECGHTWLGRLDEAPVCNVCQKRPVGGIMGTAISDTDPRIAAYKEARKAIN